MDVGPATAPAYNGSHGGLPCIGGYMHFGAGYRADSIGDHSGSPYN
jgi:hypothetical protein